MLEHDTNRRRKGIGRPGSKASRLRANPKVYPKEVLEKYGTLAVFEVAGYIYAHVGGTSRSIARLVWQIHNPDYDLTTNSKIYHIDGDGHNNVLENLTPIREEAQGV